MPRLARSPFTALFVCLSLSFGVVSAPGAEDGKKPARVDDERLLGAATDGANWLTHGRTYAEERFSPLDQIDESNVQDLQLVWTFPTRSTRGLEAVPIVVDQSGRIVWVAGYGIDERFRVTDAAQAVVVLRLRQV